MLLLEQGVVEAGTQCGTDCGSVAMHPIDRTEAGVSIGLFGERMLQFAGRLGKDRELVPAAFLERGKGDIGPGL